MNLRITALFFGLTFFGLNSFAQKNTLNDIAKIEFVKGGKAISADYGTVELVCENNVWNSYQTKSYLHYDKKTHPSADSEHKFLRMVPADKVAALLAILTTKPDSSIKFDGFDFGGMLTYADSTGLKLKADQRAQYTDALQSKSKVQPVIQRAFVPSRPDTRIDYRMVLTTKAGTTDTITGLSFQNIYHMPWLIKGVKVYNPHLGEIYEYVKGNDKYASTEKARMHSFIAVDVYVQYFQTKFAWKNLETDDPKCFALFKDKKVPRYFSESNLGWYGAFNSPQLPFYLHPYVRFKQGDTAAVSRFNRFEDTLATAYQKGNFLFDYFKRFPSCHVQVMAGEAGKIPLNTFYSIRSVYGGIESTDYKKILVLYVEIPQIRMTAYWLLLPNNMLILESCYGSIDYDADSKFTGMTADGKYTGGYFVFDSTGKKIAGKDITRFK